MKFRNGFLVLVTLSVLPFSTTLGADFELTRAAYYSPRLFGMGGAFTALSDDRNLFFTNPAGLAQIEHRKLSLGFLPVALNTNTLDLINFYTDNDQTFENINNLSGTEQSAFFDDLLREIGGKRSETSAHFPITLVVPSRTGSTTPSVGLGFFARGGSSLLAQTGASGIPVASLGLDLQYTGVLSVAWGWHNLLPGPFSAGATIKVDHRRLSLHNKSLLALSDGEDLDALSATGFGLDLGVLYRATPTVSVGAALFDVLASDFEFKGQDRTDPLALLREGDLGKLDPALSLGVGYRPKQTFGPLADLVLALDVQEPFDGDRSFWKGVHMGAEARLSWLVPRFGFFQGYPGFGAGLGPFQYAFFGSEAGHFVGSRSNYSHVLSFEWGFGL